MMKFTIYWRSKYTSHRGKGRQAYSNTNNCLINEVNRLNKIWPEIHHYLVLFDKNI